MMKPHSAQIDTNSAIVLETFACWCDILLQLLTALDSAIESSGTADTSESRDAGVDILRCTMRTIDCERTSGARGLCLKFFQKRVYSRQSVPHSVMASSPSRSGAADEAAPRKGALMRGGSFWDEGVYGLGCGLVYGMTSAVVGFVLLLMRPCVTADCQTVLCTSTLKPALYFVLPRYRMQATIRFCKNENASPV